MPDAVERARPSAAVVPALPRRPLAAARIRAMARTGTRAGAAASGVTGPLRGASTARVPLDRGATRRWAATAPPAPTARSHPALRLYPAVGLGRPGHPNV